MEHYLATKKIQIKVKPNNLEGFSQASEGEKQLREKCV